jgi:hypothetical protein
MFNTVDPPKQEHRLIELAKQDLARARDNLWRARSAARGRDVSAQWGQSGETLAEIIAEYERGEADALKTLAQARAVSPPR